MIKHTIIQVSHTHRHKVSNEHTQEYEPNSKRDKISKKTVSLEAYDLYISPPLATSYQKVQKCIVLCISQAWSWGGGVERTPRTKEFVDVVGAGGVGDGGGTEAVAAGAEVVALVSAMGTTADL